MADKKTVDKALRARILQSAEDHFLHRLHCVFLVSKGRPCKEVAEWFGYNPSTVARWVRFYNDFGVDGLRDDRHTGRPAKLNFDQLRTLQGEIRQDPQTLGYPGPHWDGKLLALHLQRRYGVTLSTRQCQRILQRLEQRPPATRAAESREQAR